MGLRMDLNNAMMPIVFPSMDAPIVLSILVGPVQPPSPVYVRTVGMGFGRELKHVMMATVSAMMDVLHAQSMLGGRVTLRYQINVVIVVMV